MAFSNLSRVSVFAVGLLSIWTISDMSAAGMNEDFDGYRDEIIDHDRVNDGRRKGGLKPFPKIVRDNGMFHFVLTDIAHELVRLLEEEEGLSLNDRNKAAIHDKIESIYDRSNDHPALASDLIAYSPKKPDYHRYTPDSVLKTQAQEKREKRRYFGPYNEVCQSVKSWESMEFVSLRNHSLVKVLPGFEFHITRCTSVSEASSCVGIDSGMGSTACQTTGSWVRALVCGGCDFDTDSSCNDHCPNLRERYHWEWVHSPTCCKCGYEFRY